MKKVLFIVVCIGFHHAAICQSLGTTEYVDKQHSFIVQVPKSWSRDSPISNKAIIMKCIDRSYDEIKMFTIQANALPNASERIDISKITDADPGIQRIVGKGSNTNGTQKVYWVDSIDIFGNRSLIYMVPKGDELYTLNFMVPENLWSIYENLAKRCLDSFAFQ